MKLSCTLGIALAAATLGGPPAVAQTTKPTIPDHSAHILTPAPPATPRINGPRLFGVRPGNPLLYTVPVTGQRPITYSAAGLPGGVSIDEQTGRLTGRVPEPGEYRVTLKAANALGVTERPFTIVVGDRVALTPPMGWNSYNAYGATVNHEQVRQAARAFVSSGLINHGWSYINIDDGWQGVRDPQTKALQPDSRAFPDMKALADDLHAMGLKIGIYATPWVVSYGGRLGGSAENPDGAAQQWPPKVPKNRKQLPFAVGKYSFAAADVKQWVAWEIDYLKYDWGPVEAPEAKEMTDQLRAAGRDIVYTVSNNHAKSLIRNIGEVAPLVNSWRTTTDIVDNWGRVQDIGFTNEQWNAHVKPGHYTDADMLVVGVVGWGKPRYTRLTPHQQYTHVTLWCMLSSPLLLGADLEQLDPFTLSLLTNDEVLAVNQDARVAPATRAYARDGVEVWRKPLEDGRVAVGVFNRNKDEAAHAVTWAEAAGVPRARAARDLWRQKDSADAAERVSLTVPGHGAYLFAVTPDQ